MRIFIAIELDDVIRRRLVRQRDEMSLGGGRLRRTSPEQMHLTLKFLGEVEDGRVAAVCEGVAEAAKSLGPFEMEVSGAGCFPPRGRVRVLWAGVTAPLEVLASCFEAVEDSLAERGFEREGRPFSPHITLARVTDDSASSRIRHAAETANIGPMTQSVNSLTVMQSQLTRGGAVYTPVSKHKFGLGRQE